MEDTEEIYKAMDAALAAVQVLTRDEEISDVEIEEIEREAITRNDPGDWLVTVGYNRQKTRTVLGNFAIPQRTLKVVRIDPRTGRVRSIKNRNPST